MMVQALLSEILAGLEALAKTGRTELIDLRSLPLSPEEKLDLEERLGTGEISATLRAAGTSEIVETQYPGVWWVRHLGSTGKPVYEAIEITRCPELLAAPRDDVLDSVSELRVALGSGEEVDHAR